jgi:hypothetical protein
MEILSKKTWVRLRYPEIKIIQYAADYSSFSFKTTLGELVTLPTCTLFNISKRSYKTPEDPLLTELGVPPNFHFEDQDGYWEYRFPSNFQDQGLYYAHWVYPPKDKPSFVPKMTVRLFSAELTYNYHEQLKEAFMVPFSINIEGTYIRAYARNSGIKLENTTIQELTDLCTQAASLGENIQILLQSGNCTFILEHQHLIFL